MVFSSSSMGILQIWTEIGTIGLVLTGWLISGVLKKKKEEGFWNVMLVLALVLFTPVTLLSVFLLVWLMANKLFEVKEHKLLLEVGEKKINAMPIIISIILLAGMGFGGYWWTRVLMGEIYLRDSLIKASNNDGTGTYNLQIKAISANPYDAEYRKLYSQTNLAIAQNMLSNQELSQEDKEKASTLVQQSVREAKAAISLNEKNPEYWSNLAAIYKSLAGLVEGAPDWSLQAYQQAVALDPVNSLLKLDMGGLLFAANRFGEADRIFEQAVISKSDYANAWYNWAYTAKKNNDIQNAVNRLDQALKLVPADSGDYETASKELEAWKKELDEATKKQQTDEKEPETLKTADPIPTVAEEEKMEVRESEMQPPAGEEVETQALPVTEIPIE
jgi:Tfp pilus assembly protein PilF